MDEQTEPSVERVANAFDISTVAVRCVMADFNRDPNSLNQLLKEKGRPIYAMPDKLQRIITRSSNFFTLTDRSRGILVS